MTVNEAYMLVSSEYPELYFRRCFEYNELFVFNFGYDNPNTVVFDSEISVNKNTKEVKGFKPFFISTEDYENGVEIFDFKETK